MRALVMLMALAAVEVSGATRILVTVVGERTGVPVKGLAPHDFIVLDDGRTRRVESVEPAPDALDVMLLLDTSLLGSVVQPLAEGLIGRLGPKDQMAVVAFHSAADLVQDFTSSRELLHRAVASVKFGNAPRVLDALYAAIDGGFRSAVYRRVIILLSAGIEGPSRMSEREVIQLARRNSVSIYPVFVLGSERAMFRRLAQQTGGAVIELRDRQRVQQDQTPEHIFEVIRSACILSVEGNLALGERFRIEVKRPERLLVSGLPLD